MAKTLEPKHVMMEILSMEMDVETHAKLKSVLRAKVGTQPHLTLALKYVEMESILGSINAMMEMF